MLFKTDAWNQLTSYSATSLEACKVSPHVYKEQEITNLENWRIKVSFPTTATDIILLQSKQASSSTQWNSNQIGTKGLFLLQKRWLLISI